MIKVGVIGYGYWGPNLVRNFSEASETELGFVADLDSQKLAKVRNRYPQVKLTRDVDELICAPDLDAVAIATPVSTHFPLAVKVLNAGKHVLVEKPLAMTYDQAKELQELAERKNLTLMVDHSFPYTGAVRKIKELIDKGDLGEIYYYDSMRVNLGLFQHDVNVIWDLAVHDLAIIDFLFPQKPVSVSATGVKHIANSFENVAYLTLYFDNNMIAHVNVNWLAPVKLRQTLVGGSKKMIVYDDLEPTEKIKLYDKGVSVATGANEIYEMRVGYRTGDMWSPALDRKEALLALVEHFAFCIENQVKPITDGACGATVVRIMEAATESMSHQGKLIQL